MPREELFPSLDKKKLSLARLPVTERFGFVWVVALVVGVSFAASGYNYYYDTSFIFDRLLIVALLFRPAMGRSQSIPFRVDPHGSSSSAKGA